LFRKCLLWEGVELVLQTPGGDPTLNLIQREEKELEILTGTQADLVGYIPLATYQQCIGPISF